MYALGLLDVGYKFGGSNPEAGLDCSGMAAFIYKNAVNVSLPHNAKQIAESTKPIALSKMRAGDMVFFNTMNRPFSIWAFILVMAVYPRPAHQQQYPGGTPWPPATLPTGWRGHARCLTDWREPRPRHSVRRGGLHGGMVVSAHTRCTLWMPLDSRLRGNDAVGRGGWFAVAE